MRKQTKRFHLQEVVYEEPHWDLLRELRGQAIEVMESLREFSPLVYGSLARGDVHKDSDVDIVIPYVIPSCLLEICLESFSVVERRISQATPWHLIKGVVELVDATVTFPLVQPTRIEHEFYRFGGFLALEQLLDESRVAGVDKRLVLIDPTDTGHHELSVLGREHEVAKRLEVSINIIAERVKVLQRRDKVGRTGVFLNKALSPDESFEMVLRMLASTNTQLRRRAE
ncbi:MAG: nucleotidyltransferase domain-containing protein [Theionarchaea archaeon]|nr:nucleotidyltransferase domain-containing protein [Theionarchaea archaeon]MBU6999874.1 nucleotidyltransferase domain-containing protein [Theionarchaea archaeon]MBU7020064.1 nucleotidyltransferase domain-containing protein [Theionarchaea archaeon]MBU7034281.1 nucleotidyltransferase domain-containing protein [Theionarchaea archaeon]